MRGLLVLFLCVFSWGVVLQKEYTISSNEIYSNDLIKNAPKFFIAQFGNAFEFVLPSKELVALFEKNKIKLEAQAEEVRFVYETSKAYQGLQKQVKDYFLKAYPSLKIQKIYLRPLSKALAHSFEASFTPSILKKSRFEFLAQSSAGAVVFTCEIVGKIEVYVATEDIRSRQNFTQANIQKQTLPFRGFFQEPALLEEIEQSQAKGFIKSTQIITRNKLSPQTLVWRGEMIDVVLQEGGVRIETRLEAQKNASLGEIITAKNPATKKSLKVKITAKGRGEVL